MLDNKIEAKEIFFKDLFDSKFLFQIPGYQRQYSWQKDNIEQLFDDILQALENSENNYFLGSIILQVIKEETDGSGVYDVVDGQQRLTTLTILMAVMRDLTENIKAKDTLKQKIFQEENEFQNTPEEVRLLVRDKDRDFFREYVLEENSTLKEVKYKNLSEPQNRMVVAIDTFKKRFYKDDMLQVDLLDKMIKYILNNCIFVYVKTGNFTSAYRLFSVLNDRGMPLTTADLLKSQCLSEIGEVDRDKYQKLWETIEDELGRDEFDKILGFIRTIFVKEKAKKSVVDEYNEIIFRNRHGFIGKKFIDYLKNITDIYREKILNAELNSCNTETEVKYYNLISLMRDYISSSDWIPAFLSFVYKFSNEEKILCFLKQLEKKFIINWIRELTPTARFVEMTKLLHLIESKNIEDEIITDEFFNLGTYKKDIERAINSIEFYSKQYCKYILLRLDMSLSENSNIIKAYKGIVTIEHILPQNPNPNSVWYTLFDEKQRQNWTNSIGNLLLLSRKKNSSANNSSFDIKIKKYFSKGITDFELTKEITKYNEWNIDNLKDRQECLIDRVLELWIS